MPMQRQIRSAALAVFGALLLASCQEAEAPPPAPRKARVVEAEPAAVALSGEGSGTVAARITANVGFLVGGRMTSRNVDVGAAVKPGDLIAKLDPSDLQNQLTAAEAQVKAAQAAVAQATPQEAAKKKLLKDGFTTQADYDQALKALQSAQADLQAAEANQKLAADQLNYATLNSPVTGVVTQIGAEAGQVVQAGQMIVQVAETGALDAVFSVAAKAASLAKLGMPVKVTLQDNPSISVTGSLREISPSADPVTGTYQAKVSLDAPPPEFRLGALVRGSVEVPGDGLVVRLPPTALIQSGDKPAVWVVSADGAVAKRDVTVDRYDTDAVLVSGGIEKGDLVVIAGVNSLAEGQKVAIDKVAAR